MSTYNEDIIAIAVSLGEEPGEDLVEIILPVEDDLTWDFDSEMLPSPWDMIPVGLFPVVEAID